MVAAADPVSAVNHRLYTARVAARLTLGRAAAPGRMSATSGATHPAVARREAASASNARSHAQMHASYAACASCAACSPPCLVLPVTASAHPATSSGRSSAGTSASGAYELGLAVGMRRACARLAIALTDAAASVGVRAALDESTMLLLACSSAPTRFRMCAALAASA